MCHGSLYDPYGHHIGFVDNFYTELGSVQMNLELEDGRTFQFNPGDLLRDRQGDWRIRKPEESVLDSMRYMHWVDRVMEEATKKKEETTMTAASIKNVIFNPPATIVFWTDGSKTVVKCNAKEEFDPERGWRWPLQSVVPTTAMISIRKSKSGSKRAVISRWMI